VPGSDRGGDAPGQAGPAASSAARTQRKEIRR
jgi:hypothetical protein